MHLSPSSTVQRPAFTLLEVLLASAIAVLLMGALYVAVSIQLQHAQVARDLVQDSSLTRNLFARIAADAAPHLPPAIPNPTGSSSAASSQQLASGATAAGGTTTGAAGASSTDPSSSSSGAASTLNGLTGPVTFNLGVQGDSSRLTLYVSRVPRELSQLAPDAVAPTLSDERRVSYWMAGGTNSDTLGLARQEVKIATSDDALGNLPPDIADEGNFVIAPEVRSLAFRYFDGSAWQNTWDGTMAGPDGTTPVGPPVAIEITIRIAPAGAANPDNEQSWKTYRHVVALPTANGTNTNTTGDGATTP